ncbi:WbqC family protein [Dinghuibacter silviterrae]|uniref:WbqC-like protein n=1 Tax=Dinghuibacter silviterrae TaxID=1539049 RepID=A0A4R8DJ58_9BACT|nr:WbqC family protein [Dinghuibacter silviterrae]TDW97040.1 WbqC-like protein [Dinghuibacter silviterrae]
MVLTTESQYFGSIDYYVASIEFSYWNFEQYQRWEKGRHLNRCYLLGPNNPLVLSVPLEAGRGQKTHLKDVRISYREQWGVRHWRSIHDAYRRSPWFEYYAHGLEPLFKERPEYLDEWNRMTQQWVLKQLKWTGEWGQTETPGERVEYKSAPMTEAPYRYPQVFEDRHGFVANLCILDLLFCEGPGAKGILEAARRENGGA